MKNFKATNPVFVFDPLDGTKNFIHGNGYFAVTIALIAKKTNYCWSYI